MTAENPATARGAAAGGVRVRRLGRTRYEPTWRAMQAFTLGRGAPTADEIWLTEHEPVYTLGVAGRIEHLPHGGSDIPILRSDRGGQVTYHGPGQIVAYVLLDLRRMGIAVRPLVRLLEQAVIDLAAARGIAAERRLGAPGVYVDGAKLAALGLRVRNGCCYHGVALNIDMDLAPFHAIDPCGYPGLRVTQARNLGITEPVGILEEELARRVLALLDRT